MYSVKQFEIKNAYNYSLDEYESLNYRSYKPACEFSKKNNETMGT